MQGIADRFAPYVLSILRIMSALLLLQHGFSKFFAWPAAMNQPAMFSLYWWAGAIEIVGGVLLLVGLFTRPVAFILAGELAFAYFIGHAPRSFFPIVNNGEAAVLFCFVYFYLAFAGGGPWSVDSVVRRRG
ncbi:MAG: DoxX family membrane protein [Rhizobiales bacterium]|nr:DoxX family membrane protein [Hyphomicrobiales bacterium]